MLFAAFLKLCNIRSSEQDVYTLPEGMNTAIDSHRFESGYFESSTGLNDFKMALRQKGAQNLPEIRKPQIAPSNALPKGSSMAQVSLMFTPVAVLIE